MSYALDGGHTMDEIGIKIERSYSKPYEWEYIEFSASNGDSQGATFLDCGEHDFKKFGKALSLFPKKIPDEYSYTIESEYDTVDFTLHAYTDKLEHTTLEIGTKSHDDVDDEYRILILAEPSAIHRLGELLVEFSKPKYRLLKWSLSPDNDVLVEWEHPKQDSRKPPKTKEGKKGWTFGREAVKKNSDWNFDLYR